MTVRIYIALFYGFTALCLFVMTGPVRADTFGDDPASEIGAIPGGVLLAEDPLQAITLPLEHTEVSARIGTDRTTVTVRQTFSNDTGTARDVTYLFPMTGGARLMALTLELDGQQEASVAIRDEAGLDVLSHRIPALAAHSALTVTVRYVQATACLGGTCEVALPLLQASLSGPEDAPHCWGLDDGLNADLPAYLQEGVVTIPDDLEAERVSLTAVLEPDAPIAQIWSDTHPIDVTAFAGRRMVDLADTNWVTNRDFVLRFSLDPAPDARMAANDLTAPRER